MATLRERLIKRNTDDEKAIDKRIQNAVNELRNIEESNNYD